LNGGSKSEPLFDSSGFRRQVKSGDMRRSTAERAWFDELTMSAHLEPFDSPLAQDRPVEG